MDRRDFLKTSGAAAVASGAVGTAALSAEHTWAPSAPPHLGGAQRLLLASEATLAPPGFGPERLARRIEVATDGRYRVEITGDTTGSELTFGCAGRHAAAHRAFAFFAGLPFAQGLGAPDQHAWLTVGGGQVLWDKLAAGFGFKPLVAGHTGASAGVWATARLERLSDLAGLTIHAEGGLAGDALRALGARPVRVAPHALKLQLAGGQIRAAEWLGPLADVSPDMQPLAQRLYEPGFHRSGMMLSLEVSKPVWDRMSASDQAIFEACAAQEHHLSLAEARGNALLAARVSAPAKWPVRLAFPDPVGDALDEALADVLESLSAADPETRRVHDSYQAFRHLLGDDLIA
jgi:TRAP-type mannitol/chloroaromatic compound transport system substrate-binding protein